KIGYKIREAQLEKIPYMLVVGDKEQSAGTVAVRDRVDGDLGTMALAELVARLQQEVKERRIRQVSTGTAGLSEGGEKFAGKRSAGRRGGARPLLREMSSQQGADAPRSLGGYGQRRKRQGGRRYSKRGWRQSGGALVQLGGNRLINA